MRERFVQVQSFGPSAMTIERDDPAELHCSIESDPAELGCRRAAATIGTILITKYGMPPGVVVDLCDEAMAAYGVFRRSMPDPEVWIMRRIAGRAKGCLERQGVDLGPEEEHPHISDLIRTRAALDTLPPNARAALVMLRFEGKSWRQIAKELDVSVPYAKCLVTKALNRLREWRPRPEPRED